MDGYLVHEYYGYDEESGISNATATTTIHGSWFNSMEDVQLKIQELTQESTTHNCYWVSYDKEGNECF